MIYFMLDDLRCPASEGLNSSLQFHGMISKLNGFIALTRTRTAEKRKTSLLGVIHTVFFIISGLSITVYVGARPPSSRNAIIRLRTPIMFAAMPTQLSLCAINILSKSCTTCRSSFVATSDFLARNIGSCINSLSLNILLDTATNSIYWELH